MAITEIAQHWSFSTSQSVPGAPRTSAEWIAEMSMVNGALASVPDFGYVTFTGCAATISGATAGPEIANAVAMTAVSSSEAPVSSPSIPPLSSTSFSVTWSSVGP